MRVSYWDNWKGIAIIAVVLIHASSSTAGFDTGSFNWEFGLVLRQMVDFAVPMFFALSGFFSVKNSSGSPFLYYKERILKIAPPYLVWTAVFLALRTPSSPPSVEEVIKGVVFGTGIGIGYFVVVLAQFVFLTPILARIHSKATHIVIIILMTGIGVAFTYSFFALNPDYILGRFPFNGLPFFVWYPFYHAGYFLARYKINLNGSHAARLACGFVFFVALSLLEGFAWAYGGNYSFGISQLKLTSFAASLALFLLAISLSTETTILNGRSAVSWLGVHSYAIYLTHILTLTAASRLLMRSDTLYALQPLFIVASTVLSLAGCAVLIMLTKRMLPALLSRNILGS